jgi:hypothetical protein
MLCEGHNAVVQNYLRAQGDNYHSIDLVTLTVELLHVIGERIALNTIDQINQVCSTESIVRTDLNTFECGC